MHEEKKEHPSQWIKRGATPFLLDVSKQINSELIRRYNAQTLDQRLVPKK